MFLTFWLKIFSLFKCYIWSIINNIQGIIYIIIYMWSSHLSFPRSLSADQILSLNCHKLNSLARDSHNPLWLEATTLPIDREAICDLRLSHTFVVRGYFFRKNSVAKESGNANHYALCTWVDIKTPIHSSQHLTSGNEVSVGNRVTG